MPRMTGTTLAQEMLEIRQNIPIILYTGRAAVSDARAKAVGIREFITKPMTGHTLIDVVQRVLGRNSRKRG